MRAYKQFVTQFVKQFIKPFSKKIIRHPAIIYCLAYLVAGWIWFVRFTCHPIYEGEAYIQPFWDEKKAVIAVTWHGRTLLTPYCWRSQTDYAALTSHHSDGEATAIFFKAFGGGAIRGAGTGKASRKPYKNKGGITAFRTMLRALKKDTSIWITADLPPGPAKTLDISSLTLARQSGVPILPMAVRSTYSIALQKTWDRFLLPLPFGRIAYVWGAPMHIDRQSSEADMEAKRQALQDELNRLSDRANARAGRGAQKQGQI